MDFDLHLTFRNMPEDKSIRHFIENEVAKLDHRFQEIRSCKVNFDLPYHHRYPGNIYNFEIKVEIPQNVISVKRHPSASGEDANIFSLIHEAFDEISCSLQDCICDKTTSNRRTKTNGLKNQKHLFERVF